MAAVGQQLAAAAADLQAAKDTEPSSPATKEITPPKPWEAAARGADGLHLGREASAGRHGQTPCLLHAAERGRPARG